MTRPNFIVVGAMKCGTRSLHEMLSQHPDIFMTRQKEIHYWDKDDLPTIENYHKHFKEGAGRPARGETTPSYAYHPKAIPRIAEYDPDMKLIFLMRNPIKRAISHLHQLERYWQRKGRSVDVVRILKAALKWEKKDKSDTYRGGALSVLGRGRYAEQLRRMFQYFPQERVLYLRLEDLIYSTDEVCVLICDFLKIRELTLPLLHINASHDELQIPDEAIDILTKYYHEHNKQLLRAFGVSWDMNLTLD